jgi:hypothetical protein
MPSNTLVAWWPDTDPGLSGFLVKTGSQWGPFGVRVRVRDDDPGPTGEEWQDVVEVSVDLTDGLAVCEIVDGMIDGIRNLSGSYRMRIAAAGRAESAARDASFDDDEDEEDTALEHYLIDLWPSAPSGMQVVREDSEYANDQKQPPDPEWPAERDPGLAAAWAIVHDLRSESGANLLPGALGTLSVERDLPGTPAKVFNRIRHVFGWPPARGGSGSRDPNTSYHDATLPEFEGRYQQVGHISTTVVEMDRPRRLVLRWNWVPEHAGALEVRPRLLTDDSIVTIAFERLADKDSEPMTRVRLAHGGIPQAWVQHLEDLWAWHLVVMASR